MRGWFCAHKELCKMDQPVHSVRQSSSWVTVKNWCEVTSYLIPYHVVAIMVCASCNSLGSHKKRTFYKALLGCTSFGHLFFGLAQPLWKLAGALTCGMVVFILAVRVALQQRQQQQQQQRQRHAYPLKSRSRTPLRGTMKNARRQAIKVTSDDKIRSNISHGDSLSSVLHTSSPLIGPKPRLVPCALHKSVLMDICPEYCERRAKAVPPLLKLRSKHSTFAPSSTPSILSPIVSDESSVSDSSCYPDSDLEEEI